MAYGDPTVIKQTSGISANDLGNVSNASELDTLISNLNDRAKSLIDEYTGRDFEYHQNETATLDGNGRREISLRRNATENGLFFPIISIAEVRQNGSALASDNYRIKPQPNSLPNRNAGILERRRAIWPEGWENIEIDLDWGFQSPPEEVKSITESLVVDQLLNAAQAEKSNGAESVSMDGFSVSFSKRMRLNEEHRARLQPFKIIAKA